MKLWLWQDSKSNGCKWTWANIQFYTKDLLVFNCFKHSNVYVKFSKTYLHPLYHIEDGITDFVRWLLPGLRVVVCQRLHFNSFLTNHWAKLMHMRSWHGNINPVFNFRFAYLFSIKFLYYFIFFPLFNLFLSIFLQSYVNSLCRPYVLLSIR